MAFQIRKNEDERVLHQNDMSNQDMEVRQLKSEEDSIEIENGSVKMKHWAFDGVRLAFADWQLTKPTSFNWQGDMEAVTMQFCLKGNISANSEGQEHFALSHRQQNTFFGKSASGTIGVSALGMQSFMVQFNKDAFLRIADGGTDALRYFAERVAADETAVFSQKSLPISPATQQAIDAILHCHFSSDGLKKVFFLSKVMELMVLQADAHDRLPSTETASFLKTAYDREQIVFAREYMHQHIETPPTIPELARIVGLNEFKLKKGYKEMFGNTIFGHLAEARLEKARQVLLEGKKTVSEIAGDMGYSSVQHFSMAFKKRHGVSPRMIK